MTTILEPLCSRYSLTKAEFEKSFPKMCKILVQDSSTAGTRYQYRQGAPKKRWRNKQS